MPLENIQQQSVGAVELTPKKRVRKLWKVLGGVAVLIVLLVLVANWIAQGAFRVSNEFIAEIQMIDSYSSYDLFSSKAKSSVPVARWNEAVKQVGPILSGKPKVVNKKVSASTERGTEATIVYEILGSDKITYSITINLIKEDGIWKVSDFSSNRK